MSTGNDPFRAGCALLDVDATSGVLRASGADAAGYLQRQLSADLTRVSVEGGVRSTLMTRKGKMIAAFEVYALGPDLCLVCERAALDTMAEGLEKLVILEDVQFQRDGERLLSVQGPGVPEVLAGVFPGVQLPEEELAVAVAERAGDRVLIARRRRSAAGGCDLLVCADSHDTLGAALVEAGAVGVDESASEAARIDAGIPRYGVDADERNLPPESGYEDAVSYTKGCYVGQEIVARIHTYGHVNQLLRRLRLPDGRCPARDAEIATVEKVVGRVTSSAVAPSTGHAVALGYVRHEIPDGARVWITLPEDRVEATVETL